MILPSQGFGANTRSLGRVMTFIDGGYLRRNFTEKTKHENIDFIMLLNALKGQINSKYNQIKPDFIRTYFYDAIVDPKHEKYYEQKKYFSIIEQLDNYEVRYGRLLKSGTNGLKQKGVDVRLAVDMITKSDQYDFAILLAGDNDFLDTVNILKDYGKRVIGVFFEDHVSKQLEQSFDVRIEISPIIDQIENHHFNILNQKIFPKN